MNRKIKCLLIKNGFLSSSKFDELYSLLEEAAKDNNIELTVKNNSDIIACIGEESKALLYDCCLFWDKDICLANFLENAGLRVFNNSRAIAVCDDKAFTHLELAKYGISMPKTIICPMTYETIGYNDLSFIDSIEKAISYPMIVKERKGSFGMQVYMAKNRKQLEYYIKNNGSKDLIFQEYIESDGYDIRINMIGNKFITAMKRISSENDFRTNISIGGNMEKYVPAQEEIKLCTKIMDILKLDYAGIDLLHGKDGKIYLCEVNSNAHFKNILDCTGVNCAKFLMRYITQEMSGGTW